MFYLTRLISIVLVTGLASFTLPVCSQPLEPVTRLSVGIERQVSLAQSIRLDGLALNAKKSFANSWLLTAQLLFLQEQVGESDFTYQEQQLLLAYRLAQNEFLEWSLYAGIVREELEQEANLFSSKNSETGYLVALNANYQFSFNHGLDLTIETAELYDNNRYFINSRYGYRFDHNWQIGASVVFAYNDKFDHDANEYRISMSYLF
ncbi:hypothetical protein [Thalassotalea sp. ND16A]|uniref:hypothetical protein n=1 Tax=Thalassotalea sp. ND16A TaxID=1535422 RepID=UPI00051D3673|nr:hypothetical protein [Thalassotalea sp. ND16A]KGJ89344.1 hypothetical protein ND16A_2237 [Thalassotalea sp. ND16A]